MPHSQIYEFDPFRPLNWREERVISLIEATGGPKRASRKFDDEYIQRYRPFLLRWRGYNSGDARMRLFPSFPDLYHAQRFREHHDAEGQATLEARLMAGMSNRDIAQPAGTSPDVVRAYEKLFFNVRDRLQCMDYIRNMVIIPLVQRAVSNDAVDILTDEKRYAIYKLMGYVGGPKVLEFMLMGFKRIAAPNRMAQLGDWMDEAFNTLTRHRGMMVMQAFSFNKFTAMQLLEMCRGVIQSAEDARLAGGAVTEFHTNVEALLEQVNISVGRRAEADMTPQMVEWEKSKVEPRADDYYGLTDGQAPEDLKVFDGFARPEPTPKEV